MNASAVCNDRITITYHGYVWEEEEGELNWRKTKEKAKEGKDLLHRSQLQGFIAAELHQLYTHVDGQYQLQAPSVLSAPC
jgi:hypothetical protein